ncbi:MAG TPA: DUF4177 domain-containing protein [Rhodanobacter sp.]|nr:DUF4177 domain-containing protein [Rhodanobacter sp.]
MATTWEYKVVTVKRQGTFKLTDTPDDSDLIALLNREGNQGWELVNALGYGPVSPVTLYLKRPR